MPATSDLEPAFNAPSSSTEVREGRDESGGGESAAPYLKKVEEELGLERGRVLVRGAVDKDWFQTTVRWLVEWVTETELTLITAFGRITRATPQLLPGQRGCRRAEDQ